MRADVTQPADLAHLAGEVEHVFDGVDILINVDWETYLVRLAQDRAPIGRFATAEELADFFIFLCSPRASYCVGATYYVDGGWLQVVT